MNNERCSQCSKKLNVSVVGDFKAKGYTPT